jgi:hypothetical protein
MSRCLALAPNQRIEQNARRYNRPDAHPRLLMRNNIRCNYCEGIP